MTLNFTETRSDDRWKDIWIIGCRIFDSSRAIQVGLVAYFSVEIFGGKSHRTGMLSISQKLQHDKLFPEFAFF